MAWHTIPKWKLELEDGALRHAAVSAQGFEARLLTQMVRLPIPSWQEL